MIENILLNKESYKITESDLPCLVTYQEGMGGSHLSILLTAQLFSAGSKVLFFTAYNMAKEEFVKQIGEKQKDLVYIESISDLEESLNAKCIIIKSGDQDLFIESIKKIPHLAERIVFIKNIETLNEIATETSLSLEKIIFSGDLDKCNFKELILKKNFKTVIAFNQPKVKVPFSVPLLGKYQSFLCSENKKGIIEIKK